MTDPQQREWPAFAVVATDMGPAFALDGTYVDWGSHSERNWDDSSPYIHRDAARMWANAIVGAHAMAMCQAWQHFRDFLNGTPEQWAEREQAAYEQGFEIGYLRGVGGAPPEPGKYGVAP